MEGPETGTYRTRVNAALGIGTLDGLLRDEYEYLLRHHAAARLDLRFFEMFFWGLDHWQVPEKYDYFCSLTRTVGRQLSPTVEESEFTALQPYPPEFVLSYKLQKRIELLKRQAKEICIISLDGELRCKPCQLDLKFFLQYGRETASFIEFVLENLESLNSQYRLITSVKQQIDFISGKLKVFRKFADPVSHSITTVKNLGKLLSQTRTWVNHLSCFACLYWIDHGMDETLASTMGTVLSYLMQETIPHTPGIIASHLEATMIPQLLARYFDFLLEELVFPPPIENDIENLREGLIILLSFMADPPEEDSEDRELILGQICSIINKLPSPICLIHYNKMRERIFATELFLERIAGVEAEIRKIYAITPNSSQFNSPRTNAIGFLDSLLKKLKKWLEGEVFLIAHLKREIQTVWEELASLRPFMQHITEPQNEQEELKYLWSRMINVVYHASYLISLCTDKGFPLWFGIICLPSVIEEIKLIKIEAKEIKDAHMYNNKTLIVKMEFRDTLLPRGTTSQVEGDFIGFKEDTRLIIDQLKGGQKQLKIISISGMPGQGKTTLAKRIYNDPQIQRHFPKTAWCYVSKECKITDLLINILHDIRKTDVEDNSKLKIEDISKLEVEDLKNILRKCLKQRRYLVVMDDIWDVRVWQEVQSSFPDDGLGSRILFTSQNHNLISQNEQNFISYPLRSFSPEESRNLMREKLFHYKGLGSEFVEIGEEIAISCKGLPLAIALVASLLGKTEQKLELWNQVAENLKPHLASEGCMHIIELSYKYLPEHLKSCFLYFGAFPRGKNVRATRLKLLWMAEGFIKENETQCLEDLADECLHDLIFQSLVVVVERSSMGRIKTCNVHDLLYDLCLEKIEEENFLHRLDGDTVFNECHSSPQKFGHHRLCIGGRDPFIEPRPTSRRMELPTSRVESLLWLDGRVIFDILKSFKVLTMLDLEDVEMTSDVFPEVILCIFHLKYLALLGRINDIPPSIAKLWNLETLILRRGQCGGQRRIPDTMWRMKSLRHVRINQGCVSLEDFEGKECYIADIETLCEVVLPNDPRIMEFLRRMTRLRKLKCVLNRESCDPTWFSIFGTLEKLEELKIEYWYGGFRCVFETCSFPQKLRKLSLERLILASWNEISTIGKQLPNLEVLKLSEFECVGSGRWDLEDGEFSNLRYLKLRRFSNLEEINVSECDYPFPSLEELVVDDCKKIKEIPSQIGEIGSLNTIKMRWCSPEASESVIQILLQQQDLGNYTLLVFFDENTHERFFQNYSEMEL